MPTIIEKIDDMHWSGLDESEQRIGKFFFNTAVCMNEELTDEDDIRTVVDLLQQAMDVAVRSRRRMISRGTERFGDQP